MQKQLLVTISNEPSCFYGVRFVSSFFMNKREVFITLLYVAPTGKNFNATSTASPNEAQTMASDLLVMSGFPKSHITVKTIEKQFGTVQDIIREGHKGLYDAVVLGRRGYLAFEGLLSSSTSREILDAKIDFPVWICKHGTSAHRHVVVATDGSEASLRIADHVGFMLKDEEHAITVCHVGTPSPQAQRMVDAAVEAVVANGVAKERIAAEIIEGKKPVEALTSVLAEKRAAVLAIGRSRSKEGTLKSWFSGSCSSRLLTELETGTLWISK